MNLDSARIKHVFLDDGGVMNDNAVRGPQWQQLIGKYFVPRLGGTAAAWAAANVAVVGEVDERYWQRLNQGQRDADHWRAYKIDWLRSMAAHACIEAPADDDACHEMAQAALLYITPRISSVYPGAIEAIKALGAQYGLYTASNEHSEELRGYLDGMGVSQMFRGFYGADLVEASKPAEAYYRRVFEHAGVDPAASLVVDDKAEFLRVAAATGARVVLVSATARSTRELPAVRSLVQLPALLRDGEIY